MQARARERDGIWLVTCALLVYSAALTADAAERETQLAQAPFVLGSRFGRSSPRLLMPRNDKFFFSSRYGKRSPPLEPPDLLSLPPLRPPQLVCEFTGVRSLYRCRPDKNHDTRKLDVWSPEQK